MKLKVISFLLILFFTPIAISQNEKLDSSKIVSYFSESAQGILSENKAWEKIDSILARNPNNIFIADTYYYNASKFYFNKRNLDSALYFANQGIQLYPTQSLALKKSKFHNLKGSVLSMRKNYTEAVEEFQYSISILEKNKDYKGVAYIQNNLANLFFSLRDYESAYEYSKASYTQLKSENDTIYLSSITGVLAISEIELNRIEDGQKHTLECLELAEKHHNPIGLIVGHYAQGELNLLRNENLKAKTSFLLSLELSEKFQQKHYAMLCKINLLKTHLLLNEYNDALIYGEQALEESITQENQNTLYSIYKNLGFAYAGIGEFKSGFEHLKIAHELFIQISDSENKAIINEILIQYETEKKEKIIVENELEISMNEKEISQRNTSILLLIALLIISIGIYYLYYRIQNQRLYVIKKEQEYKLFQSSIQGEEKERERISNEIHDGLASKITGIKIQLENLNAENSSLALICEELTKLHEETRRISHNLMPIQLEKVSLEEALKNYCLENSTPQTKLVFHYLESTPSPLKPLISKIIFRTTQELIHNVQKHAESSICFVQLNRTNNILQVSVEDEGKGLDSKKHLHSQGLEAIKKRINDLGGEFILESQVGKGTLAIIELKMD